MTRLLPLLSIVLFPFLIAACARGVEKPPENVPDWYLNTPEDSLHLYAANSATASRKKIALEKAKTGARGDLASSIETKIESMSKGFVEEAKERSWPCQQCLTFEPIQKEVTDRLLRGTTPKKEKVYQRADSTWRAFVLMELSLGKVAQEVLPRMMERMDGEARTRFRSSRVYKEMKKALEEYKKEQKQKEEQENGQ